MLSASAALGPQRNSVTPAQGTDFFSTRSACRTAPRATTLMRTATSVSPATTPVGHVKGDAAHSASPANQVYSNWKRSASSTAGKGTTQKSPLDGARGAARAARHARARGPPTACPAIHFSFCSAPRESVTPPAQSITTRSKKPRRVRDATQPATNAKEKEHGIAYPACGVTT